MIGALSLVGSSRNAGRRSPLDLTDSLNIGRDSQTTTILSDGKVLVAGGNDSNGTIKSTELYDLATRIWSSTATSTFLASSTAIPASASNHHYGAGDSAVVRRRVGGHLVTIQIKGDLSRLHRLFRAMAFLS